MKGFVFIGVAVFLLLTAAFPAQSHSDQLLLGTQLHLHLVLLNGLTTPVTRDADPFAAVVPEPVYLGEQTIVPGARMNTAR